MGCFVKCLVFFAAAVIVTSYAKPTTDCSFDACPANTGIKVRQTKTSADFKKLIVTITCKDASKNILMQCEKEEDNSFGPGVEINTYQYHGTFSYSGNKSPPSRGGVNFSDNIDINVNNNKDAESEVETFE